MRSQISQRLCSSVPPAPTSSEFSANLADVAARILYRSPLPSQTDLPVFILNAAAFPDTRSLNYDTLLPYVLARLPDEEELVGGLGYEVIFFAGGDGNETTSTKGGRPGWGWFLQAYRLLTRATRKRLQKLYIVHEKNWIRLLVETFATVVSPKSRKKIVHVSTLSALAFLVPIKDILIPPSAYLTDRRRSSSILIPHATRRRAFTVTHPLPTSTDGSLRLPRVLREATSFIITDPLIKEEGIFRISARVQTVGILKEAYDRGQKFIVWKERDVVLASGCRKEDIGDVKVEELTHIEGYELHAAAALIKMWYKEMKEPIFPQSSYAALAKFYGNQEIPIEKSQLLDMLRRDSGWSPINDTSKSILTLHLLPLLSRVADFQVWNHMTPENLAVCFAPALLHGPDPIEDLNTSGIVCRILKTMIVMWKDELAPLIDTSLEKFEESLRIPDSLEDREDPLDESESPQMAQDQFCGITYLDNDGSDGDIEIPPPLPPRPVDDRQRNCSKFVKSLPLNFGDHMNLDSSEEGDPSSLSPSNATNAVRRKPAPALLPLPRYSRITHERPAELKGIQSYNTMTPGYDELTDNDLLHNQGELPEYEDNFMACRAPSHSLSLHPSASEPSIPRKPVPKPSSGN